MKTKKEIEKLIADLEENMIYVDGIETSMTALQIATLKWVLSK